MTLTSCPSVRADAVDSVSHTRPVVLHVRSATGFGGGPEKTILNSPRFLKGLGYDARCAYLHLPGDGQDLAARARAAEAPFFSVPDRGPLDFRVLTRLVKICRANEVAIWHAHEYKSHLLGIVARRFWPMKLVTTVHGWGVSGGRTGLYYRLEKLFLPRYDAVICVSDDLHAECIRCGVQQARCHLVENAIDTEYFRRTLSPVAARRPFPVMAPGIVLGAMGRLSPEKGFDLLIRATDRLLSNGHELSLWIAGEGDARPQLETLIRQLDRTDRIHLLGHVADVRTFFQALDVFVISSLREGLPNVLLEAMSLETPVVATRVGGVPAIVRDDHNGLIVDAGLVDQLAAGIARMAADPESRQRLSHAARETVERSHSFAVRMQKVAAIYTRLLDAEKNQVPIP